MSKVLMFPRNIFLRVTVAQAVDVRIREDKIRVWCPCTHLCILYKLMVTQFHLKWNAINVLT